MRKPVVITTPYPTSEQVAAELGITQRRVRELRKLIGFEQKREKAGTAKKRSSRR